MTTANLINVSTQLAKGKGNSDDLKFYCDGIKGIYNRLSRLKLSMNFCTFSGMIAEMDEAYTQRLSKYIEELVLLSKDCVTGLSRKNTSEISNFRKRIVSLMEGFTAYADRLELCEYILNRTEYRFYDCDYSEEYYNQKFIKDIIHYVTSDEDNAAINTKISMVVKQLPIRMSKNKFYDLIENTLKLYKDSDKKSVKDYIYMLRTAATLYEPEENEMFDEAGIFINEVLKTDIQDISKERFDSFREKLDELSNRFMMLSDVFILMAEIVNDMYTLSLTNESVMAEEKERRELRNIIAAAREALADKIEVSEDIYESFVHYEGLQEKLMEKLYYPDNSFDAIAAANKDAQELENISVIRKLQSTSAFAALEEDVAMLEKADEDFIKAEFSALTEEFDEKFADKSPLCKRGMMAAVLSNLPVFFENFDKFSEYVKTSLMQCSGMEEKKACMSLINLLIQSE